LSVMVDGAPSQFRVTVDGHHQVAHPGWVQFNPHGTRTSSAFVFAYVVKPRSGSDSHTAEVHMRSPTNTQATLLKGTLVLQYQRGTLGSGGACG
jgi:hypothetical protein